MLAGDLGRGKEDFRRPGAENLAAGVAEDILRGPVELGDPALVVDRDDRIQRRFEDRMLTRFGFVERACKLGGLRRLAVDQGQAGRLAGVRGADEEQRRADIDQLGRRAVPQLAWPFPAAAAIHGRDGLVA